TDAFQRIQVFLLVEDVPGQANDVLRLAVGFREHGEDVLDGLPELPCEIARLPFAFAGPADLPGDEDEVALGGDAVREAFRSRPAGRLQNFHCGFLSLKRCTFPVSVRGNASTNSMARGYLYGAIARLTWSCRVFFISS